VLAGVDGMRRCGVGGVCGWWWVAGEFVVGWWAGSVGVWWNRVG